MLREVSFLDVVVFLLLTFYVQRRSMAGLLHGHHDAPPSFSRTIFETCSLGGEDAWSSCLAERLRKASRRLRPISSGHAQSPGRGGLPPVPPRPHASPRGPRAGPGPPAGPRHPGWAVASSCSRPLPGGGAAHRASIRERRGGGGRREEEAGFKRKAVTPHKRFL